MISPFLYNMSDYDSPLTDDDHSEVCSLRANVAKICLESIRKSMLFTGGHSFLRHSLLMSYVRHENFRTTTFVRRLRRIHKSVRRPKLFCVSYVRIRTYESFQAKLYVSLK